MPHAHGPLSSLIDFAKEVHANLSRLSRKGSEIHLTSGKRVKKHLKRLKSSLTLIWKRYKQFETKLHVIKKLVNILYKHSKNPVFGENELFVTYDTLSFDVIIERLTELELSFHSVPLNFITRGRSKVKSLQKKMSDIQGTVLQIGDALHDTNQLADKFIVLYGMNYTCIGRCINGQSYCSNIECLPGYEGYACQVKSYEFGKCFIREGNLTTFDGDEYKLNVNASRYMAAFLRHTWISFYVDTISDTRGINGVTIYVMSDQYTLLANGEAKINDVTQTLPSVKNFDHYLTGHASLEKDGDWLKFHSTIHQLTVEFSTNGNDDVTVSLSTYWKTLMGGKCGNFNGIMSDEYDYGY
ncbi:unnamed protein product [Owenia fusiformis]|uniref:Uncharacterized protein n=1 Tax=Owenia fusiformis TaxID=6347 RepID=A0A8J1TZX4_OWEFU|nr:unnamed protein product [Owenia fusiformis]